MQSIFGCENLIRSSRSALFRLAVISLSAILLPGCSIMASRASVNLADNLSHAILNCNDPKTVETALPAYILMFDGMIYSDPENISLLQNAAMLNTAYTCVYVSDRERAKKLTDKALGYAFQAVCLHRSDLCKLKEIRFQEFSEKISGLNSGDVPVIYTLGSSWAEWIQAHGDDWDAIAEISRVEAIMNRIVALDESCKNGGAHLYLGIMSTLLPRAMGGKPEVGRRHFERAIELSGGKNLMIKVSYAKYYARLVYDRPLYNRLLTEVLSVSPEVEGYTLINTMAHKQAQALLDSEDEYF